MPIPLTLKVEVAISFNIVLNNFLKEASNRFECVAEAVKSKRLEGQTRQSESKNEKRPGPQAVWRRRTAAE